MLVNLRTFQIDNVSNGEKKLRKVTKSIVRLRSLKAEKVATKITRLVDLELPTYRYTTSHLHHFQDFLGLAIRQPYVQMHEYRLLVQNERFSTKKKITFPDLENYIFKIFSFHLPCLYVNYVFVYYIICFRYTLKGQIPPSIFKKPLPKILRYSSDF